MERGSRTKKKPSRESKGKGEQGQRGQQNVCPLGTREVLPDSQEQYLFLLEFFIHHMTSERLAKLNQMFFVPTTITVEFLNFTGEDSIEITPVDPMFQPQAGVADEIEYFYSGRSVMFAIDQYTVVNRLYELIIKLCVEKKMPVGVKPDVLVGNGELDLSKHFAALRKEMLQCWHNLTPPPKVFEGEVPLVYNDSIIGCICIFVRLSAFGQTIVTQFDAPPDRSVSSYIFKGDDDCKDKSQAYKCRIIDSRTADVCRDSRDDLHSSGPPCQICLPDEYPCTPCLRPTGATLKPNVIGDAGSEKPASAAKQERSKPEMCSDVQKQPGLIQSSRGPAQPCGKAVVLKVSGVLDTGQDRKPTVTVAPETDGTEPTSDPDHDVFVLRIGKKGIVGAGEKSDIQLEMRTPKGPERGPPIRCETREIQTEEKKDKKKKKKKKDEKDKGKRDDKRDKKK